MSLRAQPGHHPHVLCSSQFLGRQTTGLLELSGVQHMRVGGACTGPQAAGLLSFVSAPARLPCKLKNSPYGPLVGGHHQSHCVSRMTHTWRGFSFLLLLIHFHFNFCIGIRLVYNVVLDSGVQQTESIILVHISTFFKDSFPM